MAIKIDLLPGYVKLKRNLHRSIAACLATLVATGSLLFLVWKQRTLDLETVGKNRDAATLVANEATRVAGEKTASLTAANPINTAVTFMTAASKTGPQRAALLDLVRRYIYEDAIISSIDISDGQKVVIMGTVRTPDEYARFLINLRRAADVNGGTLFKGLPVASGPGGFANGAAPFLKNGGDGSGQPVPQIYPVNVSAVGILLNPVQIPAEPLSTAPAAAPGLPGGPPPI